MFRNDLSRNLAGRVEHLLAKAETYPALRWLWVVGDSEDDTEAALRELSVGYDAQIVRRDTGIPDGDHAARLRRLSLTGNAYFENVRATDAYLLIHESDIISPGDLINRLVAQAQAGYCPLAGWPLLQTRPGRYGFYDSWAYRQGGKRFSNYPPYHDAYRRDAPFEVDSAGTILLIEAADASLLRMESCAILDACAQLRAMGRRIWVDPRIVVWQPSELWEMQVA
jgi:hypothetical protein